MPPKGWPTLFGSRCQRVPTSFLFTKVPLLRIEIILARRERLGTKVFFFNRRRANGCSLSSFFPCFSPLRYRGWRHCLLRGTMPEPAPRPIFSPFPPRFTFSGKVF